MTDSSLPVRPSVQPSSPTIVGGEGCWLDHRRRPADPRRGRRRDRRQHRHGVAPRSPMPSHAAMATVRLLGADCGRRRTASRCATGSSSAGCPGIHAGLLHQRRQREHRLRAAPGPRATRWQGPPRSVEGRRPPSELSRHDARHDRRRQPQHPPGRLRAAAAAFPKVPWDDAGGRGRGDRAARTRPPSPASSPSRSPAPRAPASPPATSTGRSSPTSASGTTSC